MNTSRRGFFGLLAGFLAAPRAKASDWIKHWRPADITFGNFHLPTELAKLKICHPLPDPSERSVRFIAYPLVIGQYADYYSEHDGMIEKGPECFDRLADRIEALPDGDPRKIQMRPSA